MPFQVCVFVLRCPPPKKTSQGSLMSDLFQRLCVYMDGCYILVLFWIFNYFGAALLRHLKIGYFYVFFINNRVFVVLFRFLCLFKFAFLFCSAPPQKKKCQGSLMSDLFQRLCVYIDGCYILVLFWIFLYFGCTPFETVKNRLFKAFSINNRIIAVCGGET
jgi:hypothetical protein